MKRFREIIFTTAMVIGLAFTASAQKNDDQKRPPKPEPPKVNPGDKRPRGNPPKEDKPKKPGNHFGMVNRQDDIV